MSRRYSKQKREALVSEQRTISSDIEIKGWKLPSNGEKYGTCGVLYSMGCLDTESHTSRGLDNYEGIGAEYGDCEGKAYIKRIKCSCKRAECPICYKSWFVESSRQIVRRLEIGRRVLRISGREIHVVASVPRRLWSLDYAKLRTKAQFLLKKVSFYGGSIVFHPFRWSKRELKWFFSPHFHCLGFGWINGNKVAQIHRKSGWIIKNLGVRDSVFGTAYYELSHAGVHSKYKSFTWFGIFSYNKLNIPKLAESKLKCPICGRKLVRVDYFGIGESGVPDLEGEYLVDAKGWNECMVDTGWS